MSVARDDADFMAAVDAARERGPRFMAHLLLFTILVFFAASAYWASRAGLDEVTHGPGKVIPSRQLQVVQNLEGGIVSEILIREGEAVESDQILLRIDDTRFSSSFRETRQRYLAALAAKARLEAELEGVEIAAPEELLAERPALIDDERRLMESRQRERDAAESVLRHQRDQRRQEIRELESRQGQLDRGLELAKKELAITRPLVKQGVMSEVELLRLERQVNELDGERSANRIAIPRAKAALAEADEKIAEQQRRFRTEAINDLNVRKEELARLSESIRADQDRMVRTAVRSPVAGTVQRLLVNTIGGVVQPGMDLVEIVPREDYLLIEARIRPADIAFLRPGQEARIKLSAYDYSIYGSIPASLTHISADTILDERGEPYYQIRLKADSSQPDKASEPVTILPGMTATVDILTGKKTVLDYLLKPINKARERALTER
ncbi:MAG: HlyD family type I secretion periplasmic adaptor subunit [Chromatiales bacterium]|nr:HlyD family type I secretion periplasmic adaptor subunit [Chromatiales bacterium]